MVVYTMICHWVKVVSATKAGAEGLGALIQERVEYFYAYDGLVKLTQPERLKKAFDVLTDLFDWVGIYTNTKNRMIMAYHPLHTQVRMLVVPYERWEMGIGTTYREQQIMQVQCPECGGKVAAASLITHRQI